MQQRISAREFGEWWAFYQARPFGERAEDVRSAMVACVMANAFRGKNSRPARIEDFLLWQEKADEDWDPTGVARRVFKKVEE